MANDYILKSSKEDINQYNKDKVINIVKKTWVPLGTTAEEVAEVLLNDCPEELLVNFDEIMQNKSISDILFTFERKTFDGKRQYKTVSVSLNQMYKDFYEKVPYVILLFAICLEVKEEPGFLWLHNSLQ